MTTAILPRPRSTDAIRADYEAQLDVLEHLVRLELDAYNCDLRPIVVTKDHVVMRLGPSPVSPELHRLLKREIDRLDELSREFYEASGGNRG